MTTVSCLLGPAGPVAPCPLALALPLSLPPSLYLSRPAPWRQRRLSLPLPRALPLSLTNARPPHPGRLRVPIVPNVVAAAMHRREDAGIVAALEPIALPRSAPVRSGPTTTPSTRCTVFPAARPSPLHCLPRCTVFPAARSSPLHGLPRDRFPFASALTPSWPLPSARSTRWWRASARA